MPNLKKFCPESRTEYAKDIRLHFVKIVEVNEKLFLRPIELTNLITITLLSRTNSGRHPRLSKIRSGSAIDHMHKLPSARAYQKRIISGERKAKAKVGRQGSQSLYHSY